MIIMKTTATNEETSKVVNEISRFGLKADVSRGDFRTVIGLVGDESQVPFEYLAGLPGVKEAHGVETPYKLVNREYGKFFGEDGEDRVIHVGNVTIGNGDVVIMAGPCAVESRDQLFRIAEGAKKAGAHILRGGIFKPRSSVHSFQGIGSGKDMGEEALSWLHDAGQMYEMPTITEARGESHVDIIAKYADIIQIGSRNMYDQDLIQAVARKHKPMMVKRHFGAGVEEFLSFSEYAVAEGNKDVILCERGIIPVGKGKSYTRYTLDLASIPAIKKETYLPIIADPSHAVGRRDLIFNMACASVAAGACGLMIETHYNPAEAIVDSKQMITPDELAELIIACNAIHELVANRNKKG